MQTGKITEDQYKQYMLKQIEKDKKLLAFFMAHNIPKKAQIVTERLAIIHEEIE